MRLYLTIPDKYNTEEIDNYFDLLMRAKNTNIIDCNFIDTDEICINITGATIFLTIKNKTSDTDAAAVLKKDITSLTAPLSGEAEIELTPTDTSSLLGNYIFDLKIKLSTGKIYTVAEGTMCFKLSNSTRES